MASHGLGDDQAHVYYGSAHSSHSSRRRSRRPRDEPDRMVGKLGRLQNEDSTVPWPEQSRRVHGLGKEVRVQFQLAQHHWRNRVKLAVSSSTIMRRWWEQIILAREIGGAFEITTWEEMKRIMRQRFVPGHYQRELHSKLRKLTQAPRLWKSISRDGGMLLRANVIEDREATMSRFLGGLNPPLEYKPRRPTFTATKSFRAQVRNKPLATNQDRSRTERTPPARTRDLKCFRCQGFGHYASDCLNKKVMIIRDNGEIESEEDPEPEKPEKEEEPEEYEAVPVQGKLLVARCLEYSSQTDKMSSARTSFTLVLSPR
ncbi:unnamed protein product [Microthlaspi erraticum]|uniref:CCHC-type domain-containing protein n=1 Tax=Microthlaspi erraticum TaxID=1685480 RepID=A0A6D2JRZ4_9BRAS|nr:unnamed protein product [Microthlaspi erraticum]